MKFLLYATIAFSTISQTAKAQLPYDVTVKNEAYQPLTGATIINGTTVWGDTNLSVPIGFTFNMDGKSITRFNLVGTNLVGSDTVGLIAGFSMIGTGLIDRGTTTSKSPIRYTLTGNAG